MNALLLIPYYFAWHYGRAIRDLYHNLSVLVSFVFSWFSIVVLFKTFFAPWRRLGDTYRKGFHPEEFFSAMLINIILRLFGMTIRLAVIVVGLLTTVFAVLLSVGVFLGWIFFPLVIAFLLAIVTKNLL